ncbi:MAG: hypothetical protein ACKV2V_15465 [Blastocatellia bacterium]
MNTSFPTQIAGILRTLGQLIELASGYVYLAIIATVVVLLLLKYLLDALNVSPFGRFTHRLRRPGAVMLHSVRVSRFYFPLKQALGFDPAPLMILIATAIVCYVVSEIVKYLLILLGGLGGALLAIDRGQLGKAGMNLIGVVLLGVVFYLLTLMLIVFVNWLFGLLARPGSWALHRIEPLLRIFEFGGRFAGFSFLLLYIALSFAASAISAIFLV